MKKVVVAVASAGLAVAAFADVAVSNVVVQQRWPWNGKVDIDYEVFSDSPDDSVFVYPLGFENDRNIAIAPRTLTGEGVEPAMVGARVKPGKHRMTWEMDKDEPTLHSSAFTITMHAVKGGMYLVVDLSGGPNAEKYPIRYSDVPPDITDDACRTTNLWLRLCLPGTFMMGSPTDENWRVPTSSNSKETLHQVTLTKPFYIGVFEMTQRQYSLINGDNPSARKSDCRPVDSVSYDGLRGTVAGAAWPQHSQVEPNSFFGKLRAKSGVLFDLPTEAQWEYACRAGSSSALNSGKELIDGTDVSAEVARYYTNLLDGKGGTSMTDRGASGATRVGCYSPNQWGLYDMHGNVAEWCLDWVQNDLGSKSVVDPVGHVNGDCYATDSSYRKHRAIRGGGAYFYRDVNGNWHGYEYLSNGRALRSACRWHDSPSEKWESSPENQRFASYGFRVVATPVVQ